MKLIRIAIMAGLLVVLLSACGTVDNAKKYPNMVADLDPISLGTVEAVFDKILSSQLNRTDLEVWYYPRLDAVALKFRYEFVTYWQFWDQANRREFAAALERYKEDYAARKLANQYRRTRAAYGKVQGHTEWESFSFTRTRVSRPVIELGYRFRADTPFFATLMRSAGEELNSDDNSSRTESLQIIMYFTRAQADELVRLFDQSFLLDIVGSRVSPRYNEPLILDSYSEFEPITEIEFEAVIAVEE